MLMSTVKNQAYVLDLASRPVQGQILTHSCILILILPIGFKFVKQYQDPTRSEQTVGTLGGMIM